jgi:succinate dehydrogenase / fumarate reductase flavoprotein subunit
VDGQQAEQAAGAALEPFERPGGESPYKIQHELQDFMQDLVGIVRREDEMRQALERITALRKRAEAAGVGGNREYNPGWHTALDLPNLLTVSEAITRAALERRESRGGHFRDDYPNKDATFGSFNLVIRRGSQGAMQVEREPLKPMPDELKQIIEDEK